MLQKTDLCNFCLAEKLKSFSWSRRVFVTRVPAASHDVWSDPRGPDSALPVQLLDLGDKCQPIQEPLIVAREAPQSPPASTFNGLPCRGPCEPQSPFFLPILPQCVGPRRPRPLHMLINRPHWQIWIPLGFDWRRPLASINCASGVSSPALKGGIKWCELLWGLGVWAWVKMWLLSLQPGAS